MQQHNTRFLSALVSDQKQYEPSHEEPLNISFNGDTNQIQFILQSSLKAGQKCKIFQPAQTRTQSLTNILPVTFQQNLVQKYQQFHLNHNNNQRTFKEIIQDDSLNVYKASLTSEDIKESQVSEVRVQDQTLVVDPQQHSLKLKQRNFTIAHQSTQTNTSIHQLKELQEQLEQKDKVIISLQNLLNTKDQQLKQLQCMLDEQNPQMLFSFVDNNQKQPLQELQRKQQRGRSQNHYLEGRPIGQEQLRQPSISQKENCYYLQPAQVNVISNQQCFETQQRVNIPQPVVVQGIQCKKLSNKEFFSQNYSRD